MGLGEVEAFINIALCVTWNQLSVHDGGEYSGGCQDARTKRFSLVFFILLKVTMASSIAAFFQNLVGHRGVSRAHAGEVAS